MSNVIYEAKQEGGILLNANESYRNIDADLLEKCKEALDTIEFQRYPQDDATKLREAYANYAGVDAEQVIAGNGSDELVGMLISLGIKNGKKLYTFDPDFSMYDYYVSMVNGEIIKYQNPPQVTFDVLNFIEYGRRHDIDMILFSNPNNPTGKLISNEEIINILEAFPRCPVVVDEAYIDFADTNMIPYLDKYHNLIILRTMSKAFGMASIRCGFMISCKNTMAKIRPFKVPYNVNSITQAIGVILLQESKRATAFVKEISQARDAFYEEWKQLQLKEFVLYPSQANYLYGTSPRKEAFLNALKKKDVHIRDYANSESFRITIGSAEENKLVMDTIKEVFEKEYNI